MNILKIKDPQGNWVDIPALKGDKGDPGISPTIDSTLSQANQAADAKAVGDKIDEITLTIDETLTQSGQAADAKVTGDMLNTKADQTGYYENLNVGVADQLASKNYIEDNEAYTFRPTANGTKVGTREFDTIVGGSIVWNQRSQTNRVQSTTFTSANYVIENGVARIWGTWGGNNGSAFKLGNSNISIPANHVLFIDTGLTDNVLSCRVQGLNYGTRWNNAIIKAVIDNGVYDIVIGVYANNGDEIDITFKPQFFDLTQMFGSKIADYIYSLEQATAGAGVAWFRKYFPNSYYEYNPGELMHVSDLQSHDMVGFNLWDEEWEVGGWTKNGTSSGANDRIRCKNYIRIPADTDLYFRTGNTSSVSFHCWFDIDKNSLGDVVQDPASHVIHSPANAAYMLFFMSATYGTTYNHDICINISWSGTYDGEYEPYTKHSYPLDSSLTLRGIPKLVDGKLTFDGDIYKPDGTIERQYGIVTFDGSEAWNTRTQIEGGFSVTVPDIKQAVNTVQVSNVLSSYLPTFAQSKLNSPETTSGIAAFTWGKQLFVKCNGITQLADFKAYLSEHPLTITYELATPTIEQATPYQSPQIIDPYGTEEYVTTSIVPVGHQTQYPEDLRAKIESLPWDFANLIAPVEVTYIATRNYTAGSLFIVDNILYKATANIANGGTITPNTNCTATTLAEIIAAL